MWSTGIIPEFNSQGIFSTLDIAPTPLSKPVGNPRNYFAFASGAIEVHVVFSAVRIGFKPSTNVAVSYFCNDLTGIAPTAGTPNLLFSIRPNDITESRVQLLAEIFV